MEVTILLTTDRTYPTINSPPPTTNLALNICEALRRPSLCEARDVKDELRQVFWTPGLFSGKQLIAAMCLELRIQKPLSDALDGLAVRVTYATESKGGRLCWRFVEASKLVIRNPSGA